MTWEETELCLNTARPALASLDLESQEAVGGWSPGERSEFNQRWFIWRLIILAPNSPGDRPWRPQMSYRCPSLQTVVWFWINQWPTEVVLYRWPTHKYEVSPISLYPLPGHLLFPVSFHLSCPSCVCFLRQESHWVAQAGLNSRSSCLTCLCREAALKSSYTWLSLRKWWTFLSHICWNEPSSIFQRFPLGF